MCSFIYRGERVMCKLSKKYVVYTLCHEQTDLNIYIYECNCKKLGIYINNIIN